MDSENYYRLARHRHWREAVLRKAGYKCQDCAKYGKTSAATIAHHNKPRDQYPELQYEVSNGVALCMAHHNKRHPEKAAHKEHYNPPTLDNEN